MATLEIIFIAIGLSADAFSVSIGNGICSVKSRAGYALRIAFLFGVFQALMPLAGYFVGNTFARYIEPFDHIVALVLLAFIGGRMIYEGVKSFKAGEHEQASMKELSFGALVLQAVATSIDALIIGVGFAAVGMPIYELIAAVCTIGAITFALSFAGVYVGKKFGAMLGSRAEIIGGFILVAIGLKIFIDG